MLTIIRKVILDNLMQKEIEFIMSAKNLELVCKPEVEFLRMRIHLHFAWLLLKDTALVRKLSHTHTEERNLI